MNRLRRLPVVWALLFLAGCSGGKGKQAYTFMHCPECGLEMSYNPKLDGKTCPHCGPQGPVLVPTVGPAGGVDSDPASNARGRIIAVLVVGLVVVQGAAYAWVLRRRALKKAAAAAQQRVLTCLCPFCQRKVGYTAKKIGTGVLCPRCKTAFTLPADGTPVEV